MALSYQDALNALAVLVADSNVTAATLRTLVSQLDITSTGSVTVLYSGALENGVSAGDLARGIASQDNVRILDNTEAAKFLDLGQNTNLRSALTQVFNSKVLRVRVTRRQYCQLITAN